MLAWFSLTVSDPTSNEAQANEAFSNFLQKIVDEHHEVLRSAVNQLAVADCLTSLARVATEHGYVRPQFQDDNVLEIFEGRHPMAEVCRSDPFIPNTIQLGNVHGKCKIITGPNMGG